MKHLSIALSMFFSLLSWGAGNEQRTDAGTPPSTPDGGFYNGLSERLEWRVQALYDEGLDRLIDQVDALGEKQKILERSQKRLEARLRVLVKQELDAKKQMSLLEQTIANAEDKGLAIQCEEQLAIYKTKLDDITKSISQINTFKAKADDEMKKILREAAVLERCAKTLSKRNDELGEYLNNL